MRSVETEGATIDVAIDRALELLHIERDKVDVEILENAARGLLGFGGKKARIRATVRSPLAASQPGREEESRAVSQETPERVVEESPRAPIGAADIESARHALLEILGHLGVEATVEIERHDDDACTFRVPGDAAGIVIGRHGQTLDAIEYLLNRIASRWVRKSAATPVRCDSASSGCRRCSPASPRSPSAGPRSAPASTRRSASRSA